MAERREHPRHRVHVSVRFGKANEFVQQFADNLSHGGLFVPGDHQLEEGDEIDVELDLPGLGSFRARATVAHNTSPKTAAQSDRRAGVGLKVSEADREFHAALSNYLRRVEQRKEALVLAREADCAQALQDAGYQVLPVPPPIHLAQAIENTDAPVIGVVIPPADLDDYAAAAVALGRANLAISMHSPAEIDIVLTLLDHNMAGMRRRVGSQ